eukprot:6121577-Pleurochrysis_carterae.AAC.1
MVPVASSAFGGGPSESVGASTPVRMMAPAVAKPLRMLSAYLMTTATSSPPKPLTTITAQVLRSKPRRGSVSAADPSLCEGEHKSHTVRGTPKRGAKVMQKGVSSENGLASCKLAWKIRECGHNQVREENGCIEERAK